MWIGNEQTYCKSLNYGTIALQNMESNAGQYM